MAFLLAIVTWLMSSQILSTQLQVETEVRTQVEKV